MDNADVAKIVATPSLTAWSQVHNVGGLFVVLSLNKNEKLETKNFLSLLGKNTLTLLEKEFFSLEKKDLASIKKAILSTTEDIPEDVVFSYVVAAFVKEIFYVFILKEGRIDIKRQDHFGTILELKRDSPSDFICGSMLVLDNDLLFLQTTQFNQIIPSSTLIDLVDNQSPSQICEMVAPIIHKEQDALASGIIIRHHRKNDENNNSNQDDEMQDSKKQPSEDLENLTLAQILPQSENQTNKINQYYQKFALQLFSFIKQKIRFKKKLNHSQKIFLSIAAILIIVFAVSIVLTVKKREFNTYQNIFNGVYPKAYANVQNTKGLIGVSNNQATQNFTLDKKKLFSIRNDFPAKSSWENQINTLLKSINNLILKTSGIINVKAAIASPSSSPILSALMTSSNNLAAKTNQNLYVLNQQGIVSQNLKNTKQTLIIKNTSLLENAVGFSTYYQNFYVLTNKGQILKFVPSVNGYVKTQYLSPPVQFLSQPVSLAVDGNIWIMLKDGSIQEFSNGSYDNFTVSGLTQNFSSPIQLFTNSNTKNLYILDPKNDRIVILSKNGTYKAAYKTNLLSNATAFDPQEANNVIYFLAKGQIYLINLQ